MMLVGGDDTMTYEGYARDILLNGILMNGGQPPGQGEPFYYQAFYPYFLAGTHAVFGESMFGPVLLQRLLAALRDRGSSSRSRWLTAASACGWWRCRSPRLFIGWKFWPIAAQPLNESLYVPLLVATAASLIRLCRAAADRRAALTSGVLSGARDHHAIDGAAVVGDRVAGVLAGDERPCRGATRD